MDDQKTRLGSVVLCYLSLVGHRGQSGVDRHWNSISRYFTLVIGEVGPNLIYYVRRSRVTSHGQYVIRK